VTNFFLNISAFTAAALHDGLDPVLVDAPFAAVELVDEGVSDSLQDPHFVCAIGRFQTSLHEPPKGCNANSRTDE